MPYSIRVHKDRSLVVARFEGVVGTREIVRSLAEIVAHPSFGRDYGQLVDFRAVERFDFPSEDMAELFRETQALVSEAGRPRIALVAGEDAVFGMMRMFQLMAGDVRADVGTFRSTAEARRWLGLGE